MKRTTEQLIAFMNERQRVVNKQVETIADEYINTSRDAALAMLNGVIERNNLVNWEANVLSHKVYVLLRERGVRAL